MEERKESIETYLFPDYCPYSVIKFKIKLKKNWSYCTSSVFHAVCSRQCSQNVNQKRRRDWFKSHWAVTLEISVCYMSNKQMTDDKILPFMVTQLSSLTAAALSLTCLWHSVLIGYYSWPNQLSWAKRSPKKRCRNPVRRARASICKWLSIYWSPEFTAAGIKLFQ